MEQKDFLAEELILSPKKEIEYRKTREENAVLHAEITSLK